MMTDRKNIGDILVQAGRITPTDVEDALEHQRTHGGYFGEALVAKGLVRSEEVEWALASQFDLPLIFPDPETVDPDVARLVHADWALANLAVPIVRTGDTLTVVVDDPLDTATIEELRRRTGLEIELALASPSRIRDLVRAIYETPPEERATLTGAPDSLHAFVAAAVEADADRIGVSVRGSTAIGWYDAGAGRDPGRAADGDAAAGGGSAVGTAGATTRRVRRRLAGGWQDALATAVQPSPIARAPGPGQRIAQWSATLRSGSGMLEIDARALAGDGGMEYVFRPLETLRAVPLFDVAASVPTAIASELRVLGRTGVRIAFVTDDRLLAETILPRLPAIVWGDDARAAHLEAAESSSSSSADVFTVQLESDADPTLETLDAFGFDVLTVDLSDDYPLERIVGAAPTVFVRIDGDRIDVDSARDGPDARLEALGIDWVLELEADEPDAPRWELRSVQDGAE